MNAGTAVPDRILVHLAGQAHTIEYSPGETLLEAMLRAGLDMPSSCQQGECGTCLVRHVVGSSTMRVNSVLSADDIAEGYTLACQSEPTGPDCEIEVEA